MKNESLIEQLADWVVSFDAGKIPPDVAAQAKHLLLDTLGCALAAHNEDAFQAASATINEIDGAAHCTVIGSNERTSLPNAVLLNGALIRSLDLNDIYMGPGQTGHPSDTLAVALSVAESERSTGEELLAAIVLGYEIYGRLADLAEHGTAWDYVTLSGLVAPAMAGRLMKMNRAVLAHALAIGVAQGHTLAGVRSGQLSGAKNLANALNTSRALLATLLAKHGVTGPMQILDGPRGFAAAVYGGADLTALVRPAAPPFRIMDTSIKAFPCVGTAQTIAAAAVQAHGLAQNPAEIATVKIRLADVPLVKRQLQDDERRHPRTRETADHSFYYLAAAGILDGDISVDSFKRRRWRDDDLTAFMQRIEISTDAGLNEHLPGTFPCVMELIFGSGSKKTVEMIHAPGSLKKRMTQSQLEGKFRQNAAARLSATKQDQVIQWVTSCGPASQVTALMESLRP